MKKYALYRRRGKRKEAIMTKNSRSLEDAIEIFMTIKGLDLEQFNKLFKVEEKR